MPGSCHKCPWVIFNPLRYYVGPPGSKFYLKFGSPIYVRHEVVHNKIVVEDLKSKPKSTNLQLRRYVILNQCNTN